MKQIANENYPIERKVVSRNEAKAFSQMIRINKN